MSMSTTEGVLKFELVVADIEKESKEFATLKIADVEWALCAQHRQYNSEDMLGVFLKCVTLKKNPEVEVCAKFVVTATANATISRTATHTFTEEEDDWGFAKFMAWSELEDDDDPFAIDGKFSVEMTVTADAPRFLEPAVDTESTSVMNLDDVLFADMHIALKGEGDSLKRIACNKSVVCRHSKAIYAAMSTPSTKEAISGVFEIGDDCATADNVHQFVRAMYGKWDKERMDEHAGELLMLAHFYDSERVANMALKATKRLLSMDTFWHTLTVAARINHDNLINICARFANETPKRLWQLVNQEDGQAMVDSEENKVKTKAVMVLLRAIGEKHK